MNLYLFDIDGTMMNPLRGETEAFAQAFTEVHGIYAKPKICVKAKDLGGIEDIKTIKGITSGQIYRAICEHFGIEKEDMEKKRESYIELYVDIVKRNNDTAVLFTGVKELVKELYGRKHMIGLLTGNFEGIAKAKIDSAGLSEYFMEGLGAFGSDPHESRSDLGKLALQRAIELGFQPGYGKAWSIGDTREDIICAKDSGLKMAAVATGKVGMEELRK